MKPRKRIYYTPEQKAIIWDRYKQGDSLHEIARMFDRYHSSIMPTIYQTGGFRPPVRKRHRLSLSLDEREEISRGLAEKCSIREIAKKISRAPSTVSREIRRHGGLTNYRAAKADKKAWDNALRPKACKLSQNPTLCKIIAEKMHRGWSPEQIAGWLKRNYPDAQEMNVSHETIYKTLFIQTRGALKKELQQYLRSRRTVRKSRTTSLKGKGLGSIPNAVPISERPSTVADRAIPGHWEGELIQGSKNSYIVILVERHSRYVMLAKISDNKTATVIAALIKQAQQLPAELYKTLTWDRGVEMTNHAVFTVATDIQVYFCDPQSPWQRGSNENTNRLLRQYFPKGTDLSVHSQQRLDSIARQLNERPRKTLGYESQAERFNQCVASTD
ncbi:IS30 family transposase [Providencia hangzhouensis]|uniref:Transposase and inactivated derivatives, IS30 family n=1 Tax=Providencia rettgeri TaxID=587 RepID=A0A9N8D2M7_PRORE|nr:IS30 family transposase [Providencia rettgeri]CAB5669959.1 Transposase and inactivated derivatives, IS30 family [Providencia rettgeri]CAB5700178.1 Transposase and inactivated derivatives, IS30 family [Providencia rettgeri]CAC9237831.1 Transposase and inactivated derivatives, IS30 family [Providencia rettgeri]CAC9252862.1 Transposase and inactivated derivatives, IS30 family [Providencia rettgeri]